MRALGFQGLGFRVLGFRVLGCRAKGLGFRTCTVLRWKGIYVYIYIEG